MLVRVRALVLVVTTTMLFAGGLIAAPPSGAAVWGSMTAFHSIGNEQSYTVPAGVSEVYLQTVGAPGGNISTELNDGSPVTVYGGGADGTHGYLRVRPGEVLYAEVGSPGSSTGTGGWNGGGSGGSGSQAGAGGGGASDVRLCSIHSSTCFGVPYDSALSRVVVAAGGGGAGNCFPLMELTECGFGGNPESAGGTGLSVSGGAGKGGGHGTLTAGGDGGAGAPGITNGLAGAPGGVAQGGAGGGAQPGHDNGSGDGGGGGGGYFAGGGGGQGSLPPPDCVAPFCTPGPGGGGGGGRSAFGNGLIDGSFIHGSDTAPPVVAVTPVALTTPAVDCNSPNLAGATITCTATVTGAAGLPTGAVDWSVTAGSGQFSPTTCYLQSGQCSVSYRATIGAQATQTVQAHYGGDFTSGPSTGTSNIVVNEPSADLAVTQSTQAVPKGAVFRIRVADIGPKTAAKSRLDVTLTGSGIQHVRFVSNPAASCQPEPPGMGISTAERCVLGSLPAKSVWTVTVDVAGGPAGGQVTSAATVTAASPPDPNTLNNNVTTVGHYGPGAALTTSVVAAPGPGFNHAGGTVDVSDLGPVSASGLTLDVGVVAKRVRKLAPSVFPSAGSCIRVAPVSPATFSFHCTLASLAVHGHWRVGVTVPTAASSTVTIMGTAGSTGTYDTSPLESVSSASTKATPVPPIAEAGSWLILGGDNGAAIGAYRISAQTPTVPPPYPESMVFTTQPYGTSTTHPTAVKGAWILTVGSAGIYRLATLTDAVIETSRGGPGKLVIQINTSGAKLAECNSAGLPSSGCSTPAASLVVLLAPSTISAGEQGQVMVQPRTLVGQPAVGFSGTVALSSTDNAAVLPAPHTFQAGDVFGHVFSGATFSEAGVTVVTAGLGPVSFPTGSGSVLVTSP